MSRPKVLLSNPTIPSVAFDLLKVTCDVVTAKSGDKPSILEAVPGVDAILWCNSLRLDQDILDAAGPQLKVVATSSSGYNHVDTGELKRRGIKFGNTPDVLSNAVADIAVLLALAASRRLTEGRFHIEKGTWANNGNNFQWMLGQDIAGSTIGIIGFGGIGQAIAKRLLGFGIARILYTGHREKPEGKELGARFVNLDTLAKESDFVIVAAPLTKETEHMCNADFFSKMKRTSILVNISRGQLVDQEALINALKEGQIFAAGLDVMVPEPLPPDNELLSLPNVVLLPHLGSATVSTRNAMSELAALNILRVLGGEEMFTPVPL
ncbi:glyoxylate reductase/hydroxypyruvate reductase-like [Cylas formicarius]|uniref:glyoxylate reductase/hydroxypyruvate reductase-like n=1 Tax=Cylas formicarius TaxID=197179 RepID=UPI0029588CEB|nr:glyoxylate reductase/hydroxypyruvate reductase-like [Cylas formicarius]